MFASAFNQSQKVVNTNAKLSEIQPRSTVLRSTLSSRAKQTTCNKAPAVTKSSDNRGILKPKFTDQFTTSGNPMMSLTDSNTNSKKPIFSLTERAPLNRTNTRYVKSSRTSSSTDTATSKASTITRKEVKKEMDKKIVSTHAPGTKIPNKVPLLGTSNRSRTPCTARTTIAKEADSSNQRIWQRNKTCSTLLLSKNPYVASKERSETLETLKQPIEISVQTNEKEILNHSLLVGDIKFLKPSQNIINEVEKQRKDLKTKELLKATRKFEAHSERQEEHLNDLKEFLEKSYVTKKARKTKDSVEGEQNSMDQLFNRDLPKTESITDIKARIKRKEQELLNLFDNVQTTGRLTN